MGHKTYDLKSKKITLEYLAFLNLLFRKAEVQISQIHKRKYDKNYYNLEH